MNIRPSAAIRQNYNEIARYVQKDRRAGFSNQERRGGFGGYGHRDLQPQGKNAETP